MRRTLFPALAAILILIGCTSDPEPRKFAEVPTTVDTSPTVDAPEVPLTDEPTETPPPGRPVVEKILVVVEENHSYAQMWKSMPYLRSLANQYAFATDYRGLFHPSQPNYIAMLAGSNRGITNNNRVSISGHSIMDLARANGKKAKTTADGMGKGYTCRRSVNGKYVDRHNGETVFKDWRGTGQCGTYNKDYGTWKGIVERGILGNIHFLIPSNGHNGHDASLGTADAWLKTALAPVFAGPDWQSGKLAIIVTADEDDKNSGQKVLTVVIHPTMSHVVVTNRLDHYGLHKTLARVAGIEPMGTKGKAAVDLATEFGLPIG